MAVGYVFMFSAPLLAKFAIDAILAGQDFQTEPWVTSLAALISHDQPPTMFNYLLLAAIGTVPLTAVAVLFRFIRCRYVARASDGIVC